eukprot:CAMPEP_0180426110 /NCGR_PEP_ID=MMETSP1036_2-20121128/5624_1 /TAXON_ID=632150 /ORGANISM="Azadinium spinosum, Strain 3D9" /LENGTH=71 /DNA_ID=CAMNT_0022431649 /DNA_START=20 /DNA_END=232 /DNA_ORIENTATION=-
MCIFVHSTFPDENGIGQVVMAPVKNGGQVHEVIRVHWRPCQDYHRGLERFLGETNEQEVDALAKNMQYADW